MPYVIDRIETDKIKIDNQELNIGSVGLSYQKLNKTPIMVTVGTKETVVDTILVPAKFSCGNLEPNVSFYGNLSQEEYECVEYKIYLNEKPTLDGNEIQISVDQQKNTINDGNNFEQSPKPVNPDDGLTKSCSGIPFQYGTSFLQNIISNANNGGDGPNYIGGSYIIKEQEKTTINYLKSSNLLGGGYEINTLETYNCDKEYYAILTAIKKEGDPIDVISLGVILDKGNGVRRA